MRCIFTTTIPNCFPPFVFTNAIKIDLNRRYVNFWETLGRIVSALIWLSGRAIYTNFMETISERISDVAQERRATDLKRVKFNVILQRNGIRSLFQV